MATSYLRPKPSTKVPAAPDRCAPACPACGGLDCLCRPRFFAGQLLSEEDLNRLEDYIVKKNRLHNRYLNGWGVVCGLEVLCDPCGEGVTVRPGYALSPCGDDIIVCNQEIVPICDLIKKCRRQDPNDCLSPNYSGPAVNRQDCLNGTEDWILSICYAEKPSRGITPLQQSSSCTSCSCGGSGGCGCKSKSSCTCGGTKKCSCGGASASSSSSQCGCGGKTASAQPKPAQCEPTVVCESYRFAVCKKPLDTRLQDLEDRLGPLLQRMRDCIACVEAHQIDIPKNRLNLQQWCCDIRDSLLDYMASNPGTDCSLYDRVNQLCSYQNPLVDVFNEVGEIVAELKKQCRCLAWLPPCPGSSDENCVPLATITIRKRDCKVLEICNFKGRKFALTMSSLSYWLSPLEIGYLFRKVAEASCCTEKQYDLVGVGQGYLDPGVIQEKPVNVQGYVSYMARAETARGKQINLKTLSMAQMGMPAANGAPLLTPDEMANPVQAMLASDIFQPFFGQTLSEGAATLISEFLGRGAAMAGKLDEMQTALDRQSQLIDELRTRMGGN